MYIIENRKWKIIPPLFWKYFFHSRRYVLGYPIKDQVWIFVWCRPERSDIPNSVNFEIFQKFQWILWHCLKRLNPLKFLISLKFTELGVKFPKYKYFFHGFFCLTQSIFGNFSKISMDLIFLNTYEEKISDMINSRNIYFEVCICRL